MNLGGFWGVLGYSAFAGSQVYIHVYKEYLRCNSSLLEILLSGFYRYHISRKQRFYSFRAIRGLVVPFIIIMSASKRIDQIAGHLNYPKGMLAGQVAIITGSGQGIGAECARLFANEGAKVVVADVDASTF